MKSISKPSGPRSRRPARPNASLGNGARRKTVVARPLALDDAADARWDADDQDIDLADFDYDSIDAMEEDAAGSDWLADRDLALEIAQRALH